MQKMLRWTVFALVGVAAATPLHAQDAAGAGAQREVRAVVDRLFEGMRQGDSAVVRSVFHRDARLQSAAIHNGQPVLRTEPIDGFVRAIGTPHEQVWDERISDVEIRVADPLAAAWMHYDFYLGGKFSHCGVDAFHLVRTPNGWKITQITDTRRSDCAPR